MIKLKSLLKKEIEYPMATGNDIQTYADAIDWKGKIVWMSPDKFLRLAAPLPVYNMKKSTLDRIEQRIKQQLPIDCLALIVDMNRKKVVSHEGRHRATVAKRMGIEKVPVLIYTGDAFERVPKWDKATHNIVNKSDFIPEK